MNMSCDSTSCTQQCPGGVSNVTFNCSYSLITCHSWKFKPTAVLTPAAPTQLQYSSSTCPAQNHRLFYSIVHTESINRSEAREKKKKTSAAIMKKFQSCRSAALGLCIYKVWFCFLFLKHE